MNVGSGKNRCGHRSNARLAGCHHHVTWLAQIRVRDRHDQPYLRQPCDVVMATGKARIGSVTATVLTAPDVHGHNTLLAPENVIPRSASVKATGSTIAHQ